MINLESFLIVFAPLMLIVLWLIRIYSLLEKIAKNTEKEGEQK